MRYQLIISLIAVGFAATSVAEQPRTTVGVLTCTLRESTHDRPENLMCGFRTSASVATEEKYVGTVHGLALPSIGKQVLMWTVIAPAHTKWPAGFLAQRYVKAKVDGHPPSWVGERNTVISLQFETHESAELGSSIARIDLKLSGTSA